MSKVYPHYMCTFKAESKGLGGKQTVLYGYNWSILYKVNLVLFVYKAWEYGR